MRLSSLSSDAPLIGLGADLYGPRSVSLACGRLCVCVCERESERERSWRVELPLLWSFAWVWIPMQVRRWRCALAGAWE